MKDDLSESERFASVMSEFVAKAGDHQRKWNKPSYVDWLLLQANARSKPISWLRDISSPPEAYQTARWLLRRISGKEKIDG